MGLQGLFSANSAKLAHFKGMRKNQASLEALNPTNWLRKSEKINQSRRR